MIGKQRHHGSNFEQAKATAHFASARNHDIALQLGIISNQHRSERPPHMSLLHQVRSVHENACYTKKLAMPSHYYRARCI
jgi:hypothetical protein